MIKDALRLIRVYHNLKQKDLADALGLSPSYVNEIERGKKQVTIEVLNKYSEHFRIPVSSLMYFAEHMDERSASREMNPIAAKAIKMLDWLDTITQDDDEAKVST